MSENISKLQGLYEAFGRGDIAAIVASVTDDATWGTDSAAQEIPWYRIRSGPEGVADFFATIGRDVEFTEFTPTLFLGSGDDVIVHVALTYKLTKNGKSVSTGSIHHASMRLVEPTFWRRMRGSGGMGATLPVRVTSDNQK